MKRLGLFAVAVGLVTMTIPVTSPVVGASKPGGPPAPSTTGANLQTGLSTHEDCTPHPPIRITEDQGPEGFKIRDHPTTGEPIYRPGSGVVSGDGSKESPYVIEGWCIVAPPGGAETDSAAIRIKGTNAHVHIRDNHIVGGSFLLDGFGIYYSGTGHASITENTIDETGFGIIVTTEGNEILDNTVSDSRRGLSLGARASVVQGNTLEENVLGISLFNSDDNEIRENTISENGRGILIWSGSDGNTIEDNTVNDSDRQGIRVQLGSEENTIHHNKIRKNGGDGVWLSSGPNRVHNNTLADNGRDGVVLGSDGNTVENNTIDGTSKRAIWVHESSGNIIQFNSISNNGINSGIFPKDHFGGILIERAQTNIVRSNNITENLHGITVEGKEDNTIKKNNIWKNTDAGFEAVQVDQSVDVRSNWWGCPGGPDKQECDDVLGDALYDPWLEEANPDAGTG